MIGSRWWWHRHRFFHRQTRFYHCFQTIDKQFRWLAHHVVLHRIFKLDHITYIYTAVKQLIQTNNQLTLVNGPANRHKPPKPQLCKKCNCCWDGSSVASIFCIILWTAISTKWSFDNDRMLLIFWSSNECLYVCAGYYNAIKITNLSHFNNEYITTITSQEIRAETQPNLRLNTDIIHVFRFRPLNIWLTLPKQLILMLVSIDRVTLLDQATHSIHSIQMYVIRVPIIQNDRKLPTHKVINIYI